MSGLRAALLAAAVLGAGTALAQETPSASVGVPIWMRDLVLPGAELEVESADTATPLVVRIASVDRHGTALRYDLVSYGLEPGTYDLRDYLRRVDGSTVEDLPPLSVEVRSVLPPGQVRPNQLAPEELPGVGGYTLLLFVGGAAWLAGLLAILFAGRKGRGGEAHGEPRPATLAERLRPLVEQAVAGQLSREDRAQLELALIAFWRRKLDLADAGAAESLAAIREHAEAGPLVRHLEDWLHRPAPLEEVDVAALLAPYRNLPADALDEPPTP